MKATLTEEQVLGNNDSKNNNTNNKMTTEEESAKSPDFFQDSNAIKRKKTATKRYTTTWINSRSFLCNISYAKISKENFYNEKFVIDIYALMTKNLNQFSLNRKLSNQNKHEIICMVWKECMPSNLSTSAQRTISCT